MMLMLRLLVLFFICSVAGCVRAQTPKFDYFYLEAEKCQLSGEWSAALELYAHCLDLCPDAPEALRSMGVMKYYMLRDSTGLDLIRRASDLEPENPWYLESLASIYLEKGDMQQSVDALERLSRLQSSCSDVLVQLAGLYKSLGRSEDALSVLDRIEVLEGKTPQLSIEKFRLLMDLGKPQQAFGEMEDLCNEFPQDQNCRIVMANQYMENGHPQQAKAIYDRVAQAEPTNPNLQLALLGYYEETGDSIGFRHLCDSLLYDKGTQQALRAALVKEMLTRAKRDTTQRAGLKDMFDRILSMPQPDATIWQLRLAYLVMMEASEEEVMDGMWKVLDIEPSNRLALSSLLEYYARKKDYPSMEKICRQAANYYPEQLDFYFYLSLALYEQDKNMESIEAILHGLRLRDNTAQPGQVSDMFSLLGDLYHEDNRVEEAFACYDSSLVYKDDNVACLNNYAYFLSLQGEQLDKAEEMSYRTIRLEPENKTYLDTYAWILFMKERFTEARIYIDRVVDPETPADSLLQDEMLSANVIEHAGDIYARCGLEERALYYWKLAREKNDGTATEALPRKLRKKKYCK